MTGLTITEFITEYSETPYEVVKSQRGKDLILVDDYTFAKTSKSDLLWVCSTKAAKCRARLRLDELGKIVYIINEHNHPPRQYAKSKDGVYIRL